MLAAKWLEKHCGDHKKAQEYLCSGLKSCLSRNLLYKAAVKYELEHINKLNLNREQMAMEAAKIQTTYLEDIFEKNKDFNFYIELVELLSEYNFGGTLIDFVYQQLEKEYAKQPKTVWCLAQRAINKGKPF